MYRNGMHRDWHMHSPWKYFEDVIDNRKFSSHIIMVLNTPIQFDDTVAPLIVRMWNSAFLRILVDGGADQWAEWTIKMNVSAACQMADLVVGDFDSIKQETLEMYVNHDDCTAIETDDQNQNDFTKALQALEKYGIRGASFTSRKHIFAICEQTGRFDQVVATMDTLYRADDILEGPELYLLSSSSLTWLLHAGDHRISLPEILKNRKKACGLLPIGNKCNVTTSGFRWNLTDATLEVGKLVSTSNTYDSSPDKFVSIKCDDKLVWTMEISPYLALRGLMV